MKLGVLFVLLACVAAPARADLLLVEEGNHANRTAIVVSGISPEKVSEPENQRDVERWIEGQFNFTAGLSTWGAVNAGVEAGVSLFNDTVGAAVTLEGTPLMMTAAATGVVVTVRPLPLKYVRHFHLFGKAYRPFYFVSMVSPTGLKPTYVIVGGVEGRWKSGNNEYALRFGFGRTLEDGFNCPATFEECKPDKAFESGLIVRF